MQIGFQRREAIQDALQPGQGEVRPADKRPRDPRINPVCGFTAIDADAQHYQGKQVRISADISRPFSRGNQPPPDER